MEFKKYQHIEKLGKIQTYGILNGTCYVFPKLDGTNGSIYLGDDGELKCASRRRELTSDNDNQGFYNAIVKDERYIEFFKENPKLRLFGEWLVPHTLKNYEETAWENFYVFDVMNGDTYLTYDEYKELLDKHGIKYIPALAVMENPVQEDIEKLLSENKFLVKEGIGEGLVVKRYDFRNNYNHVVWGKIITDEFLSKSYMKPKRNKENEESFVEIQIVRDYVTRALILKEYNKVINENGGWENKLISKLLGRIYNALITEEMWNIVKDLRNPTINFKLLNKLTVDKVKKEIPEVF